MATKGALGRAIEAGIGAMTGRISAPGELRTITKPEVISISIRIHRSDPHFLQIQVTHDLHSK